jgi:hypothetical protein
MYRRRQRPASSFGQAVLTWRLLEDWSQDVIQPFPWLCINPACAVGRMSPDGDPVEAKDGRFLCPECAEPFYFRCGKFLLPVGEEVPPEVCESACPFYSCCVRYRFQNVLRAEPAYRPAWSLSEIESELDDVDDEVWLESSAEQPTHP